VLELVPEQALEQVLVQELVQHKLPVAAPSKCYQIILLFLSFSLVPPK